MARKKSAKDAADKPAAPRRSGTSRSRTTRTVTRKATKPVECVSVMPCTKAQIRERAYYIFLGRQSGTGDQLGDWLQAERELNQARTGAGD